MRKLIAGINMTLDGFCDHTAMIADDEVHQHYADLLYSCDTLIYGRIAYQLMESYWPPIVKNPTGDKPSDDFAVAIENISKIVFSHTLKSVGWKNVRLATKGLEEEVSALKKQPGRDILVGSPSLIAGMMKLNLIDECQFCVHPVVVGRGLTLFKNITEKILLKLTKTKIFGSGAVIFYYEPTKR